MIAYTPFASTMVLRCCSLVCMLHLVGCAVDPGPVDGVDAGQAPGSIVAGSAAGDKPAEATVAEGHSEHPVDNESGVEDENARFLTALAADEPAIRLPACETETDSASVQAHCMFTSASLLYENGFTDRAKHELLQTVALDPTRVEAFVMLGDIYSAEEELEQAMGMYRSAIRLDNGNALLYHNLGVLFDRLGQPQQAIDSYLQALMLRPNDPRTHYHLGLAYSRSQSALELVIDHFKTALELDPGLADAHYDLARVYEYRRETRLAIEHYRRAEELGHGAAGAELARLR